MKRMQLQLATLQSKIANLFSFFGQHCLFSRFLPSATKLRRLCFYKRVSVHGGGVPDQVPPSRDQVSPRTRYTPQDQVHPPDQVHPRDQIHPPGPGTPPRTRYTPLGPGTPPWDKVHPTDQVHPPGPGTPPQTRYTRLDQVPPRTRYTPPRYGYCCGRYASYWNAFLFFSLSSMPQPEMQRKNCN